MIARRSLPALIGGGIVSLLLPVFLDCGGHATRVAVHVSPSFNALMRAAAYGRYAYMEANGIRREASTETKFAFWYGKPH